MTEEPVSTLPASSTAQAVQQLAVPDAEALYATLLTQIRAACGADVSRLAIAGIHSGGAWLARRLADDLGVEAVGTVNVAFHRDDYAKKGLHSQAEPTSLTFDVNGARILLVDDVLYTGRTVRAALNELYDYGRPAAVELAALVDRGGRELPVAARFCGGVVAVPEGARIALSQRADGRFSLALEVNDDPAAGSGAGAEAQSHHTR